MLMQNFVDARTLGIHESSREALIKTLGLLERGELRHLIPNEPTPMEHMGKVRSFTGHFNMAFWTFPLTCGTVCCMGGTAELLGAEHIADEVDRNEELSLLCYAGFQRVYMRDITTRQAASALRNYLTTGRARWEEVLRGGNSGEAGPPK